MQIAQSKNRLRAKRTGLSNDTKLSDFDEGSYMLYK